MPGYAYEGSILSLASPSLALFRAPSVVLPYSALFTMTVHLHRTNSKDLKPPWTQISDTMNQNRPFFLRAIYNRYVVTVPSKANTKCGNFLLNSQSFTHDISPITNNFK